MILWNFGIPDATPFEDVIVAVTLSPISNILDRLWKKITILIPVYNEQNGLNYKEVNFLKVEHGAEIIVINDGSIDNSKKIIEENEAYYDQFITYEKNKGKGFAIREGLKNQKGLYYFSRCRLVSMILKTYSNFLN